MQQQQQSPSTANEEFMTGLTNICGCDFNTIRYHQCSCCQSDWITEKCMSFYGSGFCFPCVKKQLLAFDAHVSAGHIRPHYILNYGGLTTSQRRALKLAMIADYQMLCYDHKIDSSRIHVLLYGLKPGNTDPQLPHVPTELMEHITQFVVKDDKPNANVPLHQGNYAGRIKYAKDHHPCLFECVRDAPICIGCARVRSIEHGFSSRTIERLIVPSGYEKCHHCASHYETWNDAQKAEYNRFTRTGYGFTLNANLVNIQPYDGGLTHKFLDYLYTCQYVRLNFLYVDEDDDEECYTNEQYDQFDDDDHERMKRGLPPKFRVRDRIERNRAKYLASLEIN